MKLNLSAPLFLLFLFPAVSFGAVNTNPQLETLNKQQDSESIADSQQLAAERAQWFKQNPQIIKDLDARGKALMVLAANPKANITVPTVPLAEQQAYDAFMKHQQAEGVAYSQKLAQEKQNYLSQNPTTTTTTTTTTTGTTH